MSEIDDLKQALIHQALVSMWLHKSQAEYYQRIIDEKKAINDRQMRRQEELEDRIAELEKVVKKQHRKEAHHDQPTD